VTTARDVMNTGVHCVGEDETLTRAAQIMRDEQVGALPICDAGGHLRGIVTDRDIVIRCVASGQDIGSTRISALAQGEPCCVQASSDIEEVLAEMESHQIRRLPVLEDDRLVGMISEADLAHHLSDERLAHFVEQIYADR
jgi:CBS domain-containing protein